MQFVVLLHPKDDNPDEMLDAYGPFSEEEASVWLLGNPKTVGDQMHEVARYLGPKGDSK